MEEEETIDEQLDKMEPRKYEPETIRKRIEELEDEVQELKHENISSASRPNIVSGNEEEIYNRLVNAYENTKINKELYSEEYLKAILTPYSNNHINAEGIAEEYFTAITKYEGKLEKELLSMDNINEEIIQRVSNYIDKKQIFNEFSPTESVKAGVFLTKVIEISPLTEITLKLERGSDIDCFGYGFAGKKKIIVQGDLGGDVGNHMKTGILEINGNVKDFCGLIMKGGKIVVHGNVNGDCGTGMRGGEIVVHRDVNDYCGIGMEGGEIVVHGNVNGFCGGIMKGGLIEIDGNANNYVAADMEGGTIYINGDQKPELHSAKLGFFGQYKITKTGGSVYHKGKLIG